MFFVLLALTDPFKGVKKKAGPLNISKGPAVMVVPAFALPDKQFRTRFVEFSFQESNVKTGSKIMAGQPTPPTWMSQKVSKRLVSGL